MKWFLAGLFIGAGIMLAIVGLTGINSHGQPQPVKVIRSQLPQHAFDDGTTFDCKPNPVRDVTNALTCISVDGNTEIHCSSDYLPNKFFAYFC